MKMDYSTLTMEQIKEIEKELSKRRIELQNAEKDALWGKLKPLLKEIFDKGYQLYDDSNNIIDLYYLDDFHLE